MCQNGGMNEGQHLTVQDIWQKDEALTVKPRLIPSNCPPFSLLCNKRTRGINDYRARRTFHILCTQLLHQAKYPGCY